jgi:hypothetical protein
MRAFLRATPLLLLCALAAPPAQAAAAPRIAGCPVFPKTSHWNQRVDRLPVHRNSSAIVRSIGSDETMHADFGSGLWEGGPIGIPFTTVAARHARVPVGFDYAAESDRGPYPIPPGAPIEGGRGGDGDRHVIVVDRARCRLYELFGAYPQAGGSRWTAGSGAIWNLRSNRLRPRGWTSADAAGLPILPGLARYGEVKRGRIDHALRFTAARTRRAFVYPARHFASELTDPDLPAMGQRLRLRRGYDISRFPRQARVVLRALKGYGMILADNGSPWYVSGAPHRGWDNEQLRALHDVPGMAFEVVDTSRLPRRASGFGARRAGTHRTCGAQPPSQQPLHSPLWRCRSPSPAGP